MIRRPEKRYRLTDMGYVPLFLSMEYVKNYYFKEQFHERAISITQPLNFGTDVCRMFEEYVYIDNATVSGINVKLVEPFESFKNYMNESTLRYTLRISEILFKLDFHQCLRYLLEYFKANRKDGTFYACNIINGVVQLPDCEACYNSIVYFIIMQNKACEICNETFNGREYGR